VGTDSPGKQGSREDGTLIDLLRQAGASLIPALLTAGGLIGFVAFAGSVIVWTRFYAAEVPPDQVVAAYPRGELVAIASALLLLFGFVGLLAVLGFFLIDGEGRATLGMSRGLLALLAVEGTVAIFLVEDPSLQKTLLACELFLLPTIIAFWATFMYEKPRPAKPPPVVAGGDEGDLGLAEWMSDLLREDVLKLVLLRSRFTVTVVTVVSAVGFVSAILVLFAGLPILPVAIMGLALIALLPTITLSPYWIREDKVVRPPLKEGEVPFTRKGVAVILASLLVVAIGPWWLLDSGWLPFSLLAAACLVAGLWRVAVLSKGKFRWYGLAVFISVPLFGTLTGVARNLADPQVQPMALIRKADGPDEAIRGLYVTETDSRIYFATVATQGCTDEVVPHSGRLLWVPKKEVVAMSIGPLQSVGDAARTSLEMSYALTPAVETPAGDNVSLTVAEQQTEAAKKPVPHGRRLESVGAAVQPNFGRGLSLTPESASPGDLVTLRMSAPNHDHGVAGFGRNREGRNLRLGGIPVDVVKENARNPWDAEYLETSEGRALRLRKGIVLYTFDGGDYVDLVRDDEIAGRPLFVRLNDSSVATVDDRGLGSGRYLRLEWNEDEPARLASSAGRLPTVNLKNGHLVTLKSHLLRQAWHEDQIKFRIPDNAATGPLTVECEQLAGQPLLRVAEPPEARISVRVDANSHRIIFDSRRSSDDHGEIVSQRWTIEGLPGGHDPRVVESLQPSLQVYTVRLAVSDSEDQVGTAELHLLRLPVDLLAFDRRGGLAHPRAVRRARVALRSAMSDEDTAAVEFGTGVDSGAESPGMALRRAERFRRALLSGRSATASNATIEPDGLTLRTLAYGARCAEGDRFDVLVLGQGVQVDSAQGCPPARVKIAHWLLP
jgi:hypothetical protein